MSVYDLTSYALISVKGPDAGKFLQGQVTCDIRQLQQGDSLLGAHCNPKGRVLISFRACQAGPDHYLLRVHRSILSSSLQQLGKYIVFSRAELRDSSDDYHILGLCEEEKTLEQAFPSLPQAGHAISSDKGTLIALGQGRYELWLNKGEEWAAALQDEGQWQALDIAAGIPEIRAETADHFIPQQINLELLGGVSFSKGCYTGQEIVARMHYRGKTKRRTQRFRLPGQHPLPRAGDKIQGSDGKEAGEILYAAQTPEGIELLAVITLSETTGVDQLQMDGTALRHLSLPYAIDELL